MNTRKPARELALDLLARSACSVQVAAVITDSKGRIIAWGWNHVTESGGGKHAEAHAVERANKRRLKGATITVAGRRRKNGNVLNSRPCKKIEPSQHNALSSPCTDILRKHGIETIEHSLPGGGWAVLKLSYKRVR